ncbi:S8/S53 family peptidase [Rufibacter radiotolerans]|uniref:S8/S53 family peptidase n=1 Tax=Rufibacter radiotolerans TaxID=1379910 RepID=UPI0018CFDFFC|nr:S8/S53 family peptidase [Rufibacter radiotolerans]
MGKSAGASSVQQVVQRVASTPAAKKFPHAAPMAEAKTLAKNGVDLSLIYQLRYTPGQSFLQIKKDLLATGLVEYVEPLYLYEPLHIPNDPLADSVSGSQNYLKIINAYRAWDISKGDSNVVVGILDTGVRLTHEDLRGNLKCNYADPIDGIDNDGDGYVDNFRGWDMADGDNDPTADANGHGTFVTGFSSAQANNGIGITGVGYNCKFLPIKVFSSQSNGPFRGYDAIVYAADHGVKVINLSWGAAGNYSAYEQDVINYAAINRDVVIVAAAGNTNAELDFYPASYQNVLSVAALDKYDVKGSSHTFSYAIDLGALGVDAFSTQNASDSRYSSASGSSFASPIVAGAAALVRSRFPTLTALQVAERIRVTADEIYTIPGNAPYYEKLGKGRLNVYRALAENTTKAARITAVNLVNNGALLPGEEVQLTGSCTNYLQPLSALTVTISSTSPYIQVLQDRATLGAMATLASSSNQATPFKIKIAANTPSNTTIDLRFSFADGAYTDFQYVKLVLNPSFLTTDVNDLVASVMSTGNIGYNGLNYSQGKGVTYRGSSPLLAEGGLLIGYSPTYVSDNIRNEKGGTDKDFYSVSTLFRQVNSPYADFHASNVMEDSLTVTKNKSLKIQQNVFAWKDNPNRGYVMLEYILTNRTTEPIENAYAGFFTDWDLLAASKNVVEWDNQLRLGFIRHITDTTLWTGIQLLSEGTPGFYALENSSATPGTINMGDGFSAQEKYLAMSGGVQREKAGFDTGKDVSLLVSSPIKSLPPNEHDTVAFAIVAGNTRAEISQSAAAALRKYQQLQTARTVTSSPGLLPADAVSLYPNPTQGQVTVSLPAAMQQTTVTVQLVNARGEIAWQGPYSRTDKPSLDFSHLASGIYYLRLTSAAGTVTKKLMLSK